MKVSQPDYHDKLQTEDEEFSLRPRQAFAKTGREQLAGLDIFYKNGNYDAIQYHDFVGGWFRGDYIKLYFHHCTLMITGINLRPEIVRFTNWHRLKYLCEQHVDKIELGLNPKDCWIESIDMVPPQLEEIGGVLEEEEEPEKRRTA